MKANGRQAQPTGRGLEDEVLPDHTDRVTVSVVSTLAGLEALERPWKDLAEHLPRLPFVTFDWASSWWNHLSAQKLTVRDRLRILAFHGVDGTLVAVAPMMITCRPAIGPIQTRQLHFLGADPNITELRTLAVKDSHADAVHAALVDHLGATADEWDWLVLGGILEGGPFEKALCARFRHASWARPIPNYYLTMPATWDAFKASLSRNIKESIRKCYNSLKRSGITFSFNVVRHVPDVHQAVDTFLRLHDMRANLEATVTHNNAFASAAAASFLRAVCTRFAERSALRIFQIIIDDRVVATRIGFVMQDTLYLYYSGYDPAYRQYSIMTTVVVEALQYAIAEGFRTVNLSTGNDVSKTRWSPREAVYREALVVSPSRRGRAAFAAHSWARAAADSALASAVARKLGR